MITRGKVLAELKKRCEKNGFSYSYGSNKKELNVPYITIKENEKNNIYADNKVFCKIIEYELIYYYTQKNEAEEEKIENNILENIVWRKEDERFNLEENCWYSTYRFKILKVKE